MSNYVKTTNFTAKDSLASGNPSKLIRGVEHDTEYDNIATAIATKEDTANKNAASGYAGLDSTSRLSSSQMPLDGAPQNSQTANYTLVLGDANKHIIYPSGHGPSDVVTIPANSSVAFPVGTLVTFVNIGGDALSIAITTDTLTLAGTTTTGTRTLAQNGIATAIKIGTTSWLISGVGLA